MQWMSLVHRNLLAWLPIGDFETLLFKQQEYVEKIANLSLFYRICSRFSCFFPPRRLAVWSFFGALLVFGMRFSGVEEAQMIGGLAFSVWSFWVLSLVEVLWVVFLLSLTVRLILIFFQNAVISKHREDLLVLSEIFDQKGYVQWKAQMGDIVHGSFERQLCLQFSEKEYDKVRFVSVLLQETALLSLGALNPEGALADYVLTEMVGHASTATRPKEAQIDDVQHRLLRRHYPAELFRDQVRMLRSYREIRMRAIETLRALAEFSDHPWKLGGLIESPSAFSKLKSLLRSGRLMEHASVKETLYDATFLEQMHWILSLIEREDFSKSHEGEAEAQVFWSGIMTDWLFVKRKP